MFIIASSNPFNTNSLILDSFTLLEKLVSEKMDII